MFLGELFNWEKKQVGKGWNYSGKKDPETKFTVTEWCRRHNEEQQSCYSGVALEIHKG